MDVIDSDDDLDWLGENLVRLREQYGGQWVAIADQRVIASGMTVVELELAMQETDAQAPLVTFVGKEEPSWLFTYCSSGKD